ncbi:MAG: malate dehydrogenase [Thermoleophilia bacterium]|nr:malate dehydrogenase [Thermoleophilia bacterium]
MKVAVIGAAGSVGAPAAFYLAVLGIAEEIILIDLRQNVIQQHAMDIGTAAATQGVQVSAGSYEDLPGTHVIINAAGVPQGLISDRMEMLPKNLPLIRDIAQEIRARAPEALVITATNPVDPLNYAMWRITGFDRRRVIGYSLNDSLRFREMVARHKGVAVREVEGFVIGEHGSTQVPLFSSVRISGEPTEFAPPEKEAVLAEIPNILRRYEELQAGRTAGWTCAVGLAGMVRAIRDDTGETFPCSVVLDGEYGLSNLSIGVPARLGRRGVTEVLEWDLAPDEKERFARSAEWLLSAARKVDEELS